MASLRSTDEVYAGEDVGRIANPHGHGDVGRVGLHVRRNQQAKSKGWWGGEAGSTQTVSLWCHFQAASAAAQAAIW